jgi:hypothetical protein
MKDIPYESTLLRLFSIILVGGALILPGTASFMSDPYSDSCVFEGDQVEEALIQPELSSQGEFCFIIDPDNIVMIGEYIQDTYPDIWQQLSLEDQDYYNSVVAVWPCGEDEPMLPNEIIRLLWLSQARTIGPTLHEQELQELTIAAQQVSAVPNLPSRFTMGNSRFAEMHTGSRLDIMSEVSNSIPNIQVLTGRSFSQANTAEHFRMARGISAGSPRIVTR